MINPARVNEVTPMRSECPRLPQPCPPLQPRGGLQQLRSPTAGAASGKTRRRQHAAFPTVKFIKIKKIKYLKRQD